MRQAAPLKDLFRRLIIHDLSKVLLDKRTAARWLKEACTKVILLQRRTTRHRATMVDLPLKLPTRTSKVPRYDIYVIQVFNNTDVRQLLPLVFHFDLVLCRIH